MKLGISSEDLQDSILLVKEENEQL
jgi:hypothetical protein